MHKVVTSVFARRAPVGRAQQDPNARAKQQGQHASVQKRAEVLWVQEVVGHDVKRSDGDRQQTTGGGPALRQSTPLLFVLRKVLRQELRLSRPVPADHGVYGGHGARDTANYMPAANVLQCWLCVSALKATLDRF